MSRLIDIVRNARETWIFICTFRDHEREPIDISSASQIVWAVSAEYGSEPLLEANLSNFIEIVDGPAGQAKISIPYADHSSIEAGTYYHECLITLSSGEVIAQFHGQLVVSESLLIY